MEIGKPQRTIEVPEPWQEKPARREDTPATPAPAPEPVRVPEKVPA